VRRELRDKYGWIVNRKRVLRIMCEDNLLCLRQKAFWLPTTNSAHSWPVFANVAAEMKGKLTGINQLWVADITYIRLEREYVYLAVVLDAYSRRVVGWALGRTAGSRVGADGLAHGGGAASPGSRAGVHESQRQSDDNAMAESFIKTLKYEEVYPNHYHDMAEAQAGIAEFIEEVYNQKRLHSALDYRSPAAFERGAA
jgi:transposase InsO family protein